MKVAPANLRRYKDVAWLFMKYGGRVMSTEANFSAAFDGDAPEAAEDASMLASDLERLGPAFVKIGQLLSTRADLLPPPFLEALSRLQDQVEPVPAEQIRKVIEEELGVRISKAFAEFDDKPLAAASLGQVHVGVLRGGRQVAVKVQRPEIRKEITADLDSLEEVASFLDSHTDFGRKYELSRIVDQFRSSLFHELDYLREAANLGELRRNLAGFRRLVVPEVVADYSTGRVLTMDYLPGAKVTSLSGAVMTDLDGGVLAEELFDAYLKQILVDGFFHADPHPGNLLLTHDRKIAILDLGMTGRIQQRMRDQLVHLLAGISEGNGVQTAEAAMSIASAKEDSIDRAGFTTAVEEIVGAAKSRNLADIDMGTIVLQVTRASAEAGLRIPQELSMMGKALLNLDRVGMVLSPGFDPQKSIQRNLSGISQARIRETLTSANLMGMLTEAKQFMAQLPLRMNRIFDLVADNKVKVTVDSLDEKALIVGLQKVANRITTGLILAALIVGSSMLARVDTTFRLWGYPSFAIVMFILAAAGALVLFFQIVIKDR
jgi:ubiquinone biosynthesis protein